MKQSDFVGLDKKVEKIYKYGCYFLDLLFISKYQEPTFEEIINYYDTFITKGYMDEECYVRDPCAILTYLTGKKYSVKKYSAKKGLAFVSSAAHVIGCYYHPMTNLHHFVVMNKYNGVLWDSIENSYTVKKGFIESYRLFKEIK